MNLSRRRFIFGSGVFSAASAFSPAFRIFAAALDEVAEPLGAYWKPHLESVSARVNELARKTVDGFWFITDLHISSNRRQSGKVLAALAGHTSLGKVVCGGDLPEAFAARFDTDKAGVDFALDSYRLFWRESIEAAGMMLFTAKGNHDYTIRHSSKSTEGFTYSGREARDFIMSSKGCASAVTNLEDPEACYYYYDNSQAKIRYVIADTTDSIDGKATFWAVRSGMHEKQLIWLADQAISTLPAGWSAVVAHHIPITGCVGTEGEKNTFASFRNLLEAYQNRGRTTLCGKSYDFASAKGRILLDITGHHHGECQTFQKGILHVSEPCDAAYGDYILRSKPWCGDLPKKEKGTIYEQTFDAVQLDPAHDLVYFTRVGGGQNRVIHTNARVIKVGQQISFAPTHVAGTLTWGCYDADRVEYVSVPGRKFQRNIKYFNTFATIAETGILTALAPGEVMVMARDTHLDKEIFPVRIEA